MRSFTHRMQPIIPLLFVGLESGGCVVIHRIEQKLVIHGVKHLRTTAQLQDRTARTQEPVRAALTVCTADALVVSMLSTWASSCNEERAYSCKVLYSLRVPVTHVRAASARPAQASAPGLQQAIVPRETVAHHRKAGGRVHAAAQHTNQRCLTGSRVLRLRLTRSPPPGS